MNVPFAGKVIRVFTAGATAVSLTIISCTPQGAPPPAGERPQFMINSPRDGSQVSGPVFFSVQPLEPGKVASVSYTVDGVEQFVDFAGEDMFKVFVIPGDFPAGELELTATVTGTNGRSRSRSVTVENVPNPPSSDTVGADGAVLGSQEQNGAFSTLTFPPGVVNGAAASFETRTQQQVLADTGVDYGALGVTFLGAQEITLDQRLDGPLGVSSGAFGPMVQNGQVVVNYMISPDVDNDGVDELVVINTASVAPNGDVISDPVPEVVLGSALISSAGGQSFLRTLQGNIIEGPPGTTIEVEATGLNGFSPTGNIAIFEAQDGSVLVSSAVVNLHAEIIGAIPTVTTLIPPLEPGPATLRFQNIGSGSTTDPVDVMVVAPPALSDTSGNIIDQEFLAIITELEALDDAGAADLIADLENARAIFQGLSENADPETAEALTGFAQLLANHELEGSTASLLTTNASLKPHQQPCRDRTEGTRKILAGSLKVTTGGLFGVGGAFMFAYPDPTTGTKAAGGALYTIGGSFVFAGFVDIFDGYAQCTIPDPPKCPTQPPIDTSFISDIRFVAPGGHLRPAQAPSPTITGMGSILPSGGCGCGGVAGTGSSGASQLLGPSFAAIEPGSVAIRIFVNNNPMTFTGLADSSGYFFTPIIPQGQPFSAVATDIQTGETRTFEGVGPAVGESLFMSFNFFTESNGPVLSWDGGGDGVSWDDPQNWDTDQVPGPTDKAVIDVVGNANVVLDAGVHGVAGLDLNESLEITGGSLTIDGPWTVDSAGDLTVNGGTFGGFGQGTIDGSMSWTGGSFGDGGDLTVNGTFTVAPTAAAVTWPDRDVTISGTFVVAGSQTVNTDANVFDNLVGGTFEVRSDAQFGTLGRATVNNWGTLVKTAGAGEHLFYTVVENRGGTLESRSGTLSLRSGGSLEDGSYEASAGATLSISNTPATLDTWTTSGTLGGAPQGTVQLVNTVSGTGLGNAVIAVPAGETAIFDVGGTGFKIRTGNIDGPGSVRNVGQFVIGGVRLGLNVAAVVDNEGTMIYLGDGSNLRADDGEINNRPGALFDIQAPDGRGISEGIFNNEGILRRSVDAGRVTISGGTFNNLGGTVEAQTGTLAISGGGAFDGGTLEAAGGATLEIDGGTFTLGGTLTGAPSGTVQLNGGFAKLIVPAGETATLNLAGEGFDYFRGTIEGPGTLANTGTFDIVSNWNKGFDTTLTFDNSGTVRHGDGTMSNDADVTFNNLAGGLYDIQDDLNYSGGTFANAGTLRKSGGAGDAAWNVCFLEQGGAVEEVSGTITITDSCP